MLEQNNPNHMILHQNNRNQQHLKLHNWFQNTIHINNNNHINLNYQHIHRHLYHNCSMHLMRTNLYYRKCIHHHQLQHQHYNQLHMNLYILCQEEVQDNLFGNQLALYIDHYHFQDHYNYLVRHNPKMHNNNYHRHILHLDYS